MKSNIFRQGDRLNGALGVLAVGVGCANVVNGATPTTRAVIAAKERLLAREIVLGRISDDVMLL
jgi:hypothetical protein